MGGDLKLETGGGNISIRSVKGNIHAETGGGNVMVLSGEQGAVIEAGGGNVEIKRCVGRVKASTGGGSINLGEIGGPADIDTGGGSIRLTSAKGRVGANAGAGTIELYGVPSARVQTGAGGIMVKFINTGAERSDSMLETSAGDITVYIAADVAISCVPAWTWVMGTTSRPIFRTSTSPAKATIGVRGRSMRRVS